MSNFRDSQGSFSNRFITGSIVYKEMSAFYGLPVQPRVYCKCKVIIKEQAAEEKNDPLFFYDLADYFLSPLRTNSTPIIPESHASTGAPNTIGTESANA